MSLTDEDKQWIREELERVVITLTKRLQPPPPLPEVDPRPSLFPLKRPFRPITRDVPDDSMRDS